MSPCAVTVMVSSLGLPQVLTDPRTNVAQCLQAILNAGLTDNDGWQMLIRLAAEPGQDELASDFRTALANRLAVVTGGPHALNYSTPDELVSLIGEFIETEVAVM